MKKFFNKIVNSKRLALFVSFFKSSEMNLSSIAVAYYLLLSLFPIMLIVANSLPYFNINTTEVMSFLRHNLPEQLYMTASPIVHSIFSQPNTGLFSVSIVVALWTFARALSFLQMAMNKAYGVSEHRDFIISRLFGIIAGFVILLFLYFAIALAAFGQMIIEQLQHLIHMNEAIYHALHNMTVPAIAISSFLALGLLYFILPNVKIKKIRYVLPGTFFSTFVLVFLTNFFGKYVSRALQNLEDFKIVGSLVIFALMIWFIFISRVLIIGSILNAVYQKRHSNQIETRRGEIVEFIKDIRKAD